jgi:hypothetical protein
MSSGARRSRRLGLPADRLGTARSRRQRLRDLGTQGAARRGPSAGAGADMRVLAGQPVDHGAQRGREWRSAGALCGYVQQRATSRRCQRSSVSGLTPKLAQAARGSERLSAASNARSAPVSVGRAACRRRIPSSWRRTRISSSFERRGRASNQTNANRSRTTRYTNDQSKQASLEHDQRAEPTEPHAS